MGSLPFHQALGCCLGLRSCQAANVHLYDITLWHQTVVKLNGVTCETSNFIPSSCKSIFPSNQRDALQDGAYVL
jgi:hypothetical protein